MSLNIGQLVGYVELDVSGVEKSASRMDGILANASAGWGKVLGAAAAGGAVLFGAGLVAGMDGEVGSDMLAASLGGGEKLAERYGDIAGRVYSAGFGGGLEDVNTAMGAVVSSIKGMRSASDAEVQKMTEKAMTFAEVMGVDVVRASQVAGNMVANGMAKNGAEAFDLLMKASQKVPVQLRDDIMDATDEYGQFFNQLGIGGPQAMGMLAAGAEKGMYGIDKAGDAIKEFTIRATDGSKTSGDAYKAMGLDAGKMSNDILAGGDRAKKATDKIVGGLLGIKDPTKQAATAIALFGTPLEDIGTKDIPGFLTSLRDGGKQLGKFKGSVDDAGKTAYDNASHNLSQFTRSIKTGFVELIGGSALPKLNDLTAGLRDNLGPALDIVTGAVKGTAKWLEKHSTVAKVLAGVVGALVAVTAAHSAVLAVGAAGGMAAWLKGTKLITTAQKVWAAVTWALNGALLANPLVLVAALVAALVVGLVIAYKKSDTFRAIVDKAFSAVKSAASAMWDGGIKVVLTAFKKGLEAVGKAGTWLWNNALQPAFKFIVKGLASILDMWADMLSTLGKVPGFGWAKDAADAMATAADKARGLADDIKKIPSKKDVKVVVTYQYKGLRGKDGSGPTRGREDDFTGGTDPKKSGKKPAKDFLDGLTEQWNAMGASTSDALGKVLQKAADGAKGKVSPGKLRALGNDLMSALRDGMAEGNGKLHDLLAQTMGDLAKGGRLAKVEKAITDLYERGRQMGKKLAGVRADLVTARDKLAEAIGKRDDFNASLLPPGALETARADLDRIRGLYDQLKSTVHDSAVAFADIGSVQLEPETTTGDVVAQMQDKLAQVVQFRANMSQLLKDGLDMGSYQRMMADGVEKSGAMAELLVQDPGAVAAVADLSTQIEAAAAGLAEDGATSMYGAGLSTAQALVDSLTAEQQRINDLGVQTAQALVDGLVLDEANLAGKAATIAEQIRAALAGALGVAIDGAVGAGGGGQTGGGKGGKNKDKDKNKNKDKSGRNAPLIGQVVQRDGESADAFAERLWFMTRTRG